MTGSAWHDFLAMGGYAAYVWPAYAVFLLVLLADALAPTVRRRHIVRDLRAQFVRQAARHAASAVVPEPPPQPSSVTAAPPESA